jgi:hypothetical protein
MNIPETQYAMNGDLAVAYIVVGSGIAFEDRGPHELKGVPGEWRLYAVAG